MTINSERDELEDRVRAAYAAGNPTPKNSKLLVENIATSEGISAAKVRRILQYGGIGYVSHSKQSKVWDDKNDAIRNAFADFDIDLDTNAFYETRYRITRNLAEELYYTQSAVSEYAKEMGFWPQTLAERASFGSKQTQSEPHLIADAPRKKSFAKAAAMIAITLVLGYFVINAWQSSSSPTATTSNSAALDAPLRGTATTSEREKFADDLSPTPSGMTSEQSDQYDQLSSEGKEATDRAVEMYDAYCDGSSEC